MKLIESLKKLNRLFVWTVLFPTLLAIIYYGLIVSDVYVSESRFVVRSPERQVTSPLALMLKGSGFSKAQDDSYTVQDFVTSRDALQALDVELGIKKAYASPDVDVFSRFAGYDWDDSLEALYLYFQKKVNVQVDTASSISTLTVKAFTADDAFAINERLVELAEQLVNKLNDRGRQDMIRFAAQEVTDAENKAKSAALALAAFRSAKGVIDPERQSQIPLQQIAKLQEELVHTRAQLAQLERVARENPQIPSLRQRATLLEDEIQAEMKRVTVGERSLAGKAVEYQRLLLDREFADKMLASAMVSLEQARNEAQRKQLYLERIVQPSRPDHAMEPRRIRGVIATLVVGLVLFAVLTMLLAGVREHLE